MTERAAQLGPRFSDHEAAERSDKTRSHECFDTS